MNGLPRTEVGPYELRAVLGKGGMGAVYRARRADLDREVALKLIRADAVASRAARARFQREARAMSLVQHPRVVRLLDADLDHDPAYLALELIEGVSLDKALGGDHGPWPKADVARLAEDLAGGVAALHEAGIVHRDLKPANVMREGDERFVVMDFGLAGGARFTRLTGEGHIVGTPAYLAPEAWLGEELTATSDVFQLGVILFEAWTGQAPYGRDMDTIASNLSSGTMDRRNLDADPLGWVILRCLGVSRDERYVDGADLLGAVRAAARGKRVPPGLGGDAARDGRGAGRTRKAPRDRGRRAGGRARRARRLTAGVGAGLLALVVAAALTPTGSDHAGTQATAIRELVGGRGTLVRWETARPTRSRVEVRRVDGPRAGGLRVEVEGPPTTDHRLHLLLPPGAEYRYAILDGAGAPGTARRLAVPADPLRPRAMAREVLGDGRVRVQLETAIPCVAEIQVDGRAVARSLEPTTTHRLEAPPQDEDVTGSRARVVLEAADGVRRTVPLVEGLGSWVSVLAARCRHLGRRAEAVVARHTRDAGSIGTEERVRVVTALRDEGVLAGFDEVRPALRDAFRDPDLPVARKLDLYEALEVLDLLDHLGGDRLAVAPLFHVAPLYRSLIDPIQVSLEEPGYERARSPFGEGVLGCVMSVLPPGPEEGELRRTAFHLSATVFAAFRAKLEGDHPPVAPGLRPEVAFLLDVPRGPLRRSQVVLEVPEVPSGQPLYLELEGRVRLRWLAGFMAGGRARTLARPGIGWSLAPELLDGHAWRGRLGTARLPASGQASGCCLRGVWVRHQPAG